MAELQERLARALTKRYAVKAELGRGGMSVVFLAWDRKHECDVALKVLRPDLASALGPDRFLQEIKTAARLKHPYILKLYDSGEAGGLLYYVMPYVETESLRQRLEREHQLPIADALRIAREVGEALDYAHRERVVHRDIKPENILFEGGHAVVSDFGIALAAANARQTDSGVALGTLEYMSPEQSAAKRELDGRSDIYSLGLVLYEMLTGEPPRLSVDGTVKTLERLRHDVPPGVGQVLRRALATDPEDRFATARTQARDGLEHDVQKARDDIQATAEKLRSESTTASDQANAWAEGIQRSWSDHVTEARRRMDARKARHDAKIAQHYAEDAEEYAEFSINLAYSAVEESEYAALEAILARQDADAATAAAS